MKPLKKISQPENLLGHLVSNNSRLYWEGFLLLSLSIDGYLLSIPGEPMLYTAWFRLMIATYLLGYILGLAPIIVRSIQRQLKKGGKGSSKLIMGIFIASFCVALILEPVLRLIAASQSEGKSYLPILVLFAFVLLHIARSRRELMEILLNTNRSGEAQTPMVDISLRITYLISISLLRASIAFTALTIGSRDYSAALYAGVLILVMWTCSLLRTQQDS
jgi:multisubunit Na+/H+ antiporter MnhE subunit